MTTICIPVIYIPVINNTLHINSSINIQILLNLSKDDCVLTVYLPCITVNHIPVINNIVLIHLWIYKTKVYRDYFNYFNIFLCFILIYPLKIFFLKIAYIHTETRLVYSFVIKLSYLLLCNAIYFLTFQIILLVEGRFINYDVIFYLIL